MKIISTMKLYFVIATFFICAVVVSTSDSAGPNEESSLLCYNSTYLRSFCPPCPPPCPGLGNCGCTFSDGTVITPKKLKYVPRPPFCERCITAMCLIRVICDETKPCTAQQIQNLINK
ncbi:hypothetical protein Bhyg_03905 [Pseudolycoriella hygida]|uniref:Uncharacterized protein n=1 Tax=Pseudolycoriella hygida TaxID=35572 RepID=A0A9Q0NE78_9DIPT|nr:hypothetical protein Bhyg_03905 [Pseudolycoriella hygida]